MRSIRRTYDLTLPYLSMLLHLEYTIAFFVPEMACSRQCLLFAIEDAFTSMLLTCNIVLESVGVRTGKIFRIFQKIPALLPVVLKLAGRCAIKILVTYSRP